MIMLCLDWGWVSGFDGLLNRKDAEVQRQS
ncbi:MAG: hypothetical protein JWQ38_310 [Flavipsychrobacter sp.]|nr:hypothetical protein [Flavipsychrobacter sp.]